MSEDMVITDREFELFRTLILKETGILLTDQKRSLVCARLAKRLRRLELSTFSQYYDYLRTRDPGGDERRELVNCITTNKTEFFREPHHFDFLRRRVLEPLARSAASGGQRKLRIWSAACSTGEEPYSLAMTVAEVLQPLGSWDIRILASDIDTQVLERAALGRYPREAGEQLSPERRRRWCRGSTKDEFEIDPALRQLVTFRQINFVREPWPIRTRFDVIFCRNVMIYFGRDTQEKIYNRFHELLNPGGFLVAGHSENLLFMAHRFDAIGQTVYRRRSSGQSRRSLRPPVHVHASRPPNAEQQQRRAPSSRPPARRRSSAQRRAARPREGRASKRPGRVSLVPSSRASAAPNRRLSAQPKPDNRWTSLGPPPGPGSLPTARFSLEPRSPPLELRITSRLPPPGELSRLSRKPPVRARAGEDRSASAGDVEPAPEPRRVRIMSGELFASDSPAVVSTLLGSCVAACLYDPALGIGGMNHFMLPSGEGGNGYDASCFGTNAMELLINELLRLGARREHLQARAFGAAHVIVGTALQAKVSAENARFIREFLASERIPLIEESLGGQRPLLVNFETHMGRANVQIAGDHAGEVVRADATFKAQLERELKPKPDDVTLF